MVGLFLLSIVLHSLFCVRTTIDTIIFPNVGGNGGENDVTHYDPAGKAGYNECARLDSLKIKMEDVQNSL